MIHDPLQLTLALSAVAIVVGVWALLRGPAT